MPEDDLPAYPLSGMPGGAVARRLRSVLPGTICVDDVDPNGFATREGAHHRAKGPGRAAGATDDPSEIIGMNPDLQDLAPTKIIAPHSHILIVVDDALDQVLQRLVEHDQTSGLATSDASTAVSSSAAFSVFGSAFSAFGSAFSAFGSAFSAFGSALSALSALSAFSAFGSAFFRFVVAPSLGSDIADLVAASYSAVLSGFGSARRRVPSVPGRPLNVCQSPVIFRSAATCSVGCAPTPSQYCTRSESISMIEGSWVGWYLPISSIARPSRLVREFMMTTR